MTTTTSSKAIEIASSNTIKTRDEFLRAVQEAFEAEEITDRESRELEFLADQNWIA